MKRQNIKKLLEEHYKKDMVVSILAGRRKPNLEVIDKAQKRLKIPIMAWKNIKLFLGE